MIVAKQLPVRTVWTSTGQWKLSSGRTLATSSLLSPCCTRNDQIDVKWVGCPNSDMCQSQAAQQEEYEDLLYDYDCIPVFLQPPLSTTRFYDGFCKSRAVAAAALRHAQGATSTSGRCGTTTGRPTQPPTRLYASVVTHAVETPTDMIWIQNYHLLLLPSFLRTKLPRAKIGLFIHTPFPSSDVFRVLPTRQNILSSMLATDLIGFHTFDYARHFLSAASSASWTSTSRRWPAERWASSTTAASCPYSYRTWASTAESSRRTANQSRRRGSGGR